MPTPPLSSAKKTRSPSRADRTPEAGGQPAAQTEKPEWNKDWLELWHNGKLVKKFRGSAKAKMAILDAFEAGENGERWPPKVSVPKKLITSPKKLQDVVARLNKDQEVLEFFRVGKYDLIGWRLRPQESVK
jgi:hypothetical protein